MEQIDIEHVPYSWRSDYRLIGAGLVALFLMAAALTGDAYSLGFYSFLRIVVTLTAALIAWRAHQQRDVVTAVISGLIAILFNPILPIELERSTWQPIDFVLALWFGWVALADIAAAKQKRWLRFAPILAVVGLGIAISVFSAISTHADYTNANEGLSASMPTTGAEIAPPSRTIEQRVADAFEAATGVQGELIETEDGQTVTTKPLKLVQLPFTTVLLTQRKIKDGCHACTGAIGVFYVKEEGNSTTVTGRWPKAVEGWGWGAPPTEWDLTNKFTSNSAIYASGGFMGQGITMESATITELTSDGPKTSDVIGTGFSDEGAIVEDSRAACIVEGKIANIRKDRSFDVIVGGAVSSIDRYVKKNGRFVKAKAIDWGVPCSRDDAPTEGEAM